MSDAAARTTWDALAPRYRAQERLEGRALAAAVRLATAEPAERLIDLATGTGALLRSLERAQGRPAEAIGVDQSSAMLTQVPALPIGWRTICADVRDVPLPDGCADVVTCCYLMHLLSRDERIAVLREARRLLRESPAPRLVLATIWISSERAAGAGAQRLLTWLAAARPRTWGGLLPLDPTEDLHVSGFRVTHRVQLVRGGYPSLILRARPQ
ncbi:MAG: hypothetical protein NVSMB51_19860 [Solirubrobacteraceae bacterium]